MYYLWCNIEAIILEQLYWGNYIKASKKTIKLRLVLLTPTDDGRQICCSASRSNLKGCSHSREGSSHILGRYASSPHCAKLGLAFYWIKWLIASDIYIYLDYVLSDFLSQIDFVLKKSVTNSLVSSARYFWIISVSRPAHPCCSQSHSGNTCLSCMFSW